MNRFGSFRNNETWPESAVDIIGCCGGSGTGYAVGCCCRVLFFVSYLYSIPFVGRARRGLTFPRIFPTNAVLSKSRPRNRETTDDCADARPSIPRPVIIVVDFMAALVACPQFKMKRLIVLGETSGEEALFIFK